MCDFWRVLIFPLPVFVGPPVEISKDYVSSVAGLAGGNLVICKSYSPSFSEDISSVTIEVYSAQTLRLLSSTTIDTATADFGGPPRLEALANGSFVLVWSGTYSLTMGHHHWYQIFDPRGIALGPPQLVSPDGRASHSAFDVAELADGRIAIAFDHFVVGSNGPSGTGSWDADVRLIGADGNPGAVVSLTGNTDIYEGAPRVVGLADGGFLAIWLVPDIISSGPPVSQIRARSFGPDGSPTSTERVIWTTEWDILDPELTVLAGGQLALSWRQVVFEPELFETAIAMASANGDVILEPVLISTAAHAGAPRMVGLQDGRLFYSWHEFDIQTSTVTLFGGYISADGVLSDTFTLIPGFRSSTGDHTVVELADGRLILNYTQLSAASFGYVTMQQLLDPREASIDLVGSAAADSWVGTSFADVLNGDGGSDQINGAAGNDTILGGVGNDLMIGGAGADQLDGGDGRDRAQYTDARAGLRADLQVALYNTGFAAGDTYAGVEDLYGSVFGDTLLGDTGANVIWGDAGDDPWLDGRLGNDTLFGGVGNDVLIGGAGADFLDGGAGNRDRAQYSDANAGLRADLLVATFNSGFARNDSYLGIEDLYGSFHSDTLLGDAGGNIIWGDRGSDLIDGRTGNDTLLGGIGLDTLIGGSGADTFVFNTAPAAGNVDAINDYSVVDDTIQLAAAAFAGLGAGALAGTAFTVGAGATTAAHRIIYNSANGQLLFDADGSNAGGAVQIATLATGLAMTAGEFLVV